MFFSVCVTQFDINSHANFTPRVVEIESNISFNLSAVTNMEVKKEERFKSRFAFARFAFSSSAARQSRELIYFVIQSVNIRQMTIWTPCEGSIQGAWGMGTWSFPQSICGRQRYEGNSSNPPTLHQTKLWRVCEQRLWGSRRRKVQNEGKQKTFQFHFKKTPTTLLMMRK